jgi:hypothetical protein
MNKRQIASSGVMFGVLEKDVFHGDQIKVGGYKVALKFVLLPNTPLPFPNHHYDPPQLSLMQVKNQFALWGAMNMSKAKFSSHILGAM